MKQFVLAVMMVGYAAVAAAQEPPVILVVGKGFVAFGQPATTLAQANSFKYRAYVDALPAKDIKPTCTGTATPFVCTFPLTDLVLPATGNHTLAITAAVVAVDGEEESDKGIAPFVLEMVARPVAPVPASFRIQPGS
jgi:hypothetical protein